MPPPLPPPDKPGIVQTPGAAVGRGCAYVFLICGAIVMIALTVWLIRTLLD